MRKFLDTILGSKWAIFIPLICATALVILFLIFGKTDNMLKEVAYTLLLSTVWFFGVFFIHFMQIKNPSCPETFQNVFMFCAIVIFGFIGIFDIFSFFASGCKDFNATINVGPLTYAATAFAYSKRKKSD